MTTETVQYKLSFINKFLDTIKSQLEKERAQQTSLSASLKNAEIVKKKLERELERKTRILSTYKKTLIKLIKDNNTYE